MCKFGKKEKKAAENKCIGKGAKIAICVAAIGIAAGTGIAVGLDQFMKRIFVNDEWPNEEWSGDDWAGEELE